MDTSINGEVYIDIDDALKRVGGNMDLYKRLLGRFVEGNHFEGLSEAIQKGETEESERQAHTIKGVGANLSLVKVATLSADLEQLLKAGSDISALFEDLRQAYDTTVDMIKKIVS